MKFDVITIGTATRDIFLTSELFKIVADPEHLKKIGFLTGEAQCFALGGKVEVSKPIMTTGGGATNAAATFSRQGFKTAALIKIGGDQAAEDILRELKKEKIASLAIREKRDGTATSVILLSPGGERTILVYRGASEDLKINEIPFGKLKTEWAYVVPGKIPLPVLQEIFSRLARNKTLIALNPSRYLLGLGVQKIKPLLAQSKVVILNREEAAYLTGVDYKNERKIFEKLDKLTPGIAVMTDGANGVMVSDGRKIYQTGIFKEQKVVDRTGAGDAFGSGFVAGLMRKKETCEKGLCRPYNIEYAVRLGSANATSVVEYIGAKEGILSEKEFEKTKRWRGLKITV